MKEKLTKDTPEKLALKLGKECKRCGSCCRHGSGIWTADDIKKAAKHLKISEEELIKNYLEQLTMFNTTLHKTKTLKENKPYGVCILFDEKQGCTIQDVKPLHCRIGNCNEYGEELSAWFMLNQFVNKNDPESVRQWKLYLETGGKNIPGGELENLVPDKEQLKKILSYEILK